MHHIDLCKFYNKTKLDASGTSAHKTVPKIFALILHVAALQTKRAPGSCPVLEQGPTALGQYFRLIQVWDRYPETIPANILEL
jgi:hypothetical protein